MTSAPIPTPSTPRFDVEVELIGHDGNAFAILGKVNRALRSAGATEAERKEFMDAATAGDYDALLVTCMEWVNVA